MTALSVVDIKCNYNKYKSYDCVLEKDSNYYSSKTRSKKVKTSWCITLFWILLSVSTAVLATYSFLQADWVVKRNVIITKLYLPADYNTSASAVRFLNNWDKAHHHQQPQQQQQHQQLHHNTLTGSSNKFSPATSRVRSSKLVRKNYSSASSPNRIHHLATLLNLVHLEAAAAAASASSSATFTPISNSNSSSINSSSSNHSSWDHGGHSTAPTNQYLSLHTQRARKVTKLMTTIRFGVIGVCSSFKTYIHCRLFGPADPHPVPRVWNLVLVIGGMGCMTLCAAAVLSILAVALPSSQLRYRIATTIGHAQMIAVILLLVSLLVFPLGFDSEFVKFHCGTSSGPYSIPDCEIGWAYALVLVCASLALYCPILVKFTADLFDPPPKYL